MCHEFVRFYCWIIFHWIDISHFVCSFTSWWTFGLFPDLVLWMILLPHSHRCIIFHLELTIHTARFIAHHSFLSTSSSAIRGSCFDSFVLSLFSNVLLEGSAWWCIFRTNFPVDSEGRVCLQWGRLRFDPWVRKIPRRRKWQPTPAFLPGKSYGQRSLAGNSSQGCRVRHNWMTSLHCIL